MHEAFSIAFGTRRLRATVSLLKEPIRKIALPHMTDVVVVQDHFSTSSPTPPFLLLFNLANT